MSEIEDRLTRLEKIGAGYDVDNLVAELKAEIPHYETEDGLAKWDAVVEQLVADNGWSKEEANTNFINLLHNEGLA